MTKRLPCPETRERAVCGSIIPREPRHFLMDSKGDLFEVSEELAEQYAKAHSRGTITVDHIDKKTNTIWFSSPLPKEVKVDA